MSSTTMKLYREKLVAELRAAEAMQVMISADERARSSMLEADIEAGFVANKEYHQARRQVELAAAALYAAQEREVDATTRKE